MRLNHRTEAPDLRESNAPTADVTAGSLDGYPKSDLKKGYCDIDGKKGQECDGFLEPSAENLQSAPFGFLGRSNGWDR